MSILTSYREDQGKCLSSILLTEIDKDWCREAGEMAQIDEDLPMGAVLCLNEEGQYLPYGHTSAAEAPAAGILLSQKLSASEEKQTCVVLKRGAVVAKNNLFWLSTVQDEEKKKALAALATLGIIAKE